MSPRHSTNVARFVHSAWAMLAFQLIASAAAAAIALWAVIEVRDLVEERDALVAQVAELEAGRRNQPGAAPAPMREELQAAAPPPVSTSVSRGEATVNPVRARRPTSVRPRDEATTDVPPEKTRPPDENVPVPVDRPQEPKPQDPTPKAATLRR